MNSKENILIICFTFPPSIGIGGRRWSKFAKYLSKLDKYNVHVLCHNTGRAGFYGLAEFGLEDVKVHEFSGYYPSILRKKPKGLFQKIRYKIWIKILPLLVKGNYYDQSCLMKRKFQSKLRQLQSLHNFSKVYITIAPFYLAYFALSIKKEFKSSFIVDFRDPWTWGGGYGYKLISSKRLEHDKATEQFVVAESDVVTSPSFSIIKYLKDTYVSKSVLADKFLEVPHAVDAELFPYPRDEYLSKNGPKIGKFIYAGTLYEEYNIFLERLIVGIKELEKRSFHKFEAFQFDIYTLSDYSSLSGQIQASGLEKKIVFHSAIGEKELFRKFPDYDASIIFFPDKYKNFISTKFYELIYCNLPIYYVGNDGRVSDFLEENKQGISVTLEGLVSGVVEMMTNDMVSRSEEFLKMDDFLFSTITFNMDEEIIRIIRK